MNAGGRNFIPEGREAPGASRPVFAAVFWVALLIRLVAVETLPHGPLQADALGYDTIAWNLVEGRGFSNASGEPTAFRSYTYPLFLAAVYRFAGHDPMWARRVQALLGAGICWLVCLIADRLFDPRAAKWAGWLSALYLPLILSTADILSEVLFTFLLLAAMLGLISKRETRWRLVCGLTLGLALMARPILALFFPGLLIWLIAVHGRRFLKPAAAALAGVVLAVAPWVARNHVQFGALIPLTTHGGVSLYNSYVLPPRGFGFIGAELADGSYGRLSGEVSRDRYLAARAFEFIAGHPLEVARLTVIKGLYLLYPFDGRWHALSFGSKYNIFWGMLLSYSVLGVALCRRNPGPEIKLIGWLGLSLVLAMLVVQAIPRYRLPMEPFLICFAAMGIREGWKRRKAVAWALALANVFLFAVFRFFEPEGLFAFFRHFS